MRVEIIRADGKHETHELARAGAWDRLHELLGCDTFDTVNLRDGRIMVVDDVGHAKRLPRNQEATRLYHSVCRPGVMLTPIVGDVAIVPEADDDGSEEEHQADSDRYTFRGL